MVYGKWNKGRSEWSLTYDVNGYKSKGAKSSQLAEYTLTDGSIYTIERNDVESLRKSIAHDAKLTYNWADTTATVFQASLSGAFNDTPDDYNIKEIADGARRYRATSRMQTKAIRRYWISTSSVRSLHGSQLPPMPWVPISPLRPAIIMMRGIHTGMMWMARRLLCSLK